MPKHSDSITVSIVAGVNPGYEGSRFTIHHPAEAAEHLGRVTQELGIRATVYPGRCFYEMDRGCPVGGEPVGVLYANGSLSEFEALRQKLEQEFLPVVTVPGSGVPTIGFIVDFGEARIKDIKAVAARWQNAAAAMLPKLGFHVSGVVYVVGGKICGRAEANPARIKDLAAWEKAARELIETIKPGAKPLFRALGYHGLKAG